MNDRGELRGVLAIDDVLAVIAGDVQDIASTIRTERQIEGTARP